MQRTGIYILVKVFWHGTQLYIPRIRSFFLLENYK